MNLTQEWYKKYRNEIQATNKDNVIVLSGSISKWDEINAKKVKELVEQTNGDITIRLNSPGGDAFEGIEIYNYLKSVPNKITVEVTALAASAGTFICMGADEVVMCTGSQMMIHNAWTFAVGNQYDLLQTADDLSKIDQSIRSIYSERTGIDEDTIDQYMTEAKMWTADEAVKLKFANRKATAPTKGTPEEKVDTPTDAPVNKLKQLFGGK